MLSVCQNVISNDLPGSMHGYDIQKGFAVSAQLVLTDAADPVELIGVSRQ